MNKQEAELKLLRSRRENIFRKVQILYDLIKEVKSDRTKLSVFKARFKELSQVSQAFGDVCDRINTLQLTLDPKTELVNQEIQSFDSMYYEIIAFADDLNIVSDPSVKSSNTNENEKPAQPRLPKIVLPVFDGTTRNWITFHDQFKSLIHDNSLIPASDKFNYLLSCVSGPALATVRSLPLSESNYPIVWERLRKKYYDKRVIGSDLLDTLLAFTPSTRESTANLNKFLEIFVESVTSLKNMKIPNLSDFILLRLGLRCLAPETRKSFEAKHLGPDIPSFDELASFIEGQAKVLEVSFPSENKIHFKNNKQFYNNDKQDQYKPNSSRRALVSLTSTPSSGVEVSACPICKLSHTIYKCPSFNKLSPSERRFQMRKLKHCFNCLRSNHMINSCRSKTQCLLCGARHHTLLHDDNSNYISSASSPNFIQSNTSQSSQIQCSTEQADPKTEVSCHLTSQKEPTYSKSNQCYTVLLGTANVHIRSFSGEYIPVRALIDSGAQASFITSRCVQRLGLPVRKCDIPVSGLGLTLVGQTVGVTSCTIKPIGSNTPLLDSEAIILSRITSAMPTRDVSENIYKHYKHLQLADPKFNTSSSIDFLIGADLFTFIFDGQKVNIDSQLPPALHSIFGWVVVGPCNLQYTDTVTTLLSEINPVLSDDIIKKFWEVEEPPEIITSNPEDTFAEEIYISKHYRDSRGRYVVPLLMKPDLNYSFFASSYSLSLSRLTSLERRFEKCPDLKLQYQEFLDEYVRLGHMTKIKHDPLNIQNYYIPHHAVTKESSSTTKLRVVFDASSKSRGQASLNEFLFTGSKLQRDIVDIISRFRLHTIIFTSDICKMYRQILIRPDERRFQHIIWRKSFDAPLEEYELNTVTYGLTSSPYLALRTLQQLAADEGHKFPRAVKVLSSSIYIDDILSGANSLEEALLIKDELTGLLRLGGFELRKWSSNCTDFISSVPEDLRETPLNLDPDGPDVIKLLGLQFDPCEDCFSYITAHPSPICTKRKILSFIARIYDPLGWLSPVIFRIKYLLQHLWRLGIEWDEETPSFISEQWIAFCNQVRFFSDFKLPRYVLQSNYSGLNLVGFCDASEKGYCAVIYLHVTSDERSPTSHLLLAKSKVAPLKTLTIPRLELCGAVLLSKLTKYIFHVYFSILPIKSVYLFTDSKTVLSWLKTPPHILKTFVSSRVVQILDAVPPSSWHYVASDSNPADCASRGLKPKELINHPLWFNGPPWLSEPLERWPNSSDLLNQTELPELKPITSIHSFHSIRQFSSWIPLLKYSSISKLQRVIAWCIRYCHSCHVSEPNRTSGPLSCQELELALMLIIRETQREAFSSEIQALQAGRLPVTLKLLTPFLDSAGCLRVGGRLVHSELPKTSIHPLILPKYHHITNLIIDLYHLKYLHIGPRALQATLARQYWIVSARNVIRSRLSKCLVCFKTRPRMNFPMMGNLPSPRVTPAVRPFINIGIDFGGPFLIKEGHRRNSKLSKCYLCLIVCLATKAVHLEAVSDLSTDAFLAAFDRFVARRGMCSNAYTDCGTNFVGAKRHFSEIFEFLISSKNEISRQFSKRSIKFWLNPPSAPHFNGLSEAGIRSAKYHLKRTLGKQALNFEELTTLFCRVEAIMNSRPICALSPDPSELDVLTPGHFIIGGPLIAVPEVNISEEKINRLTRWQLLTHSAQHFWKRWSREYLHTLQQRSKWFTPQRDLNVGDLVLVVDDKAPPQLWRTARIEQVHPGSDGTVRVATIKTSTGTFLRPAVKLCPLPLQ